VDFGDGVARHPTQIYESLFHLGMAGFLARCLASGAFRDRQLQLYLIVYCAFRFGMEWIRPEPAWLFGLTFYQCAALVFAAFLAIQWLAERPIQPGSIHAVPQSKSVPLPESVAATGSIPNA
jgi:prolipoprotein diacylglyceryltransferase